MLIKATSKQGDAKPPGVAGKSAQVGPKPDEEHPPKTSLGGIAFETKEDVPSKEAVDTAAAEKPTGEEGNWKEASGKGFVKNSWGDMEEATPVLSSTQVENSSGYYSDLSDDDDKCEDEGGAGMGDSSRGLGGATSTPKISKKDLGKAKVKEQKLKNDEWFKSVTLNQATDGNVDRNDDSGSGAGTGAARKAAQPVSIPDESGGFAAADEADGKNTLSPSTSVSNDENGEAKLNPTTIIRDVAANVATKELGKDDGTTVMSTTQKMLHALLGTQSKAKDVLFLNIGASRGSGGDASEYDASAALLNVIKENATSFMSLSVDRKLNESCHDALKPLING